VSPAKAALLVIFCAAVAVGLAHARQTVPAQQDTAIPAQIPAAQVPPTSLPSPQQQAELQQSVKDVRFDFDQSELTPEARATLQANAEWLKSHPNVLINIEGNADERGDIVYNLVLSDERAKAAKEALVEMGVPEGQIVYATGWGKLYPICTQEDESCWSQNRRAHFVLWSGEPGR
jgi:peptidoglycan-associated lipoprotein